MTKKLIPLCENHLFSKAYRKGKSAGGRFVAVYALKNYRRTPDGKPSPNRMGITVNKKLGKAVKRSRAKRLIRAAYRSLLPEMRDGYLIVVVARAALFDKGVMCRAVEKDMAKALRKLELLPNVPPQGEKTDK